MRIGIDARMYRSSAAGIGRYTQNLIKNILEIDKDNQYILFMTSEDAKEYNLKAKNAEVKIVDVPHYSYGEQIKFLGILKKEKLDLVHFTNFNYPILYKKKFVVTIHDLTLVFYPETAKETSFIKRKAFKLALGRACKYSAKIIAVSENTKQDIIKAFKVDSQKIKVIYEAADDKTFSEVSEIDIARIKTKYNIKMPVILYVGQFRPHKNIPGLIEAFGILNKKIACKLVLLGKTDGFNLDKNDKISDILMPGFVSNEELAAWYKVADVFCFPSFYEGFGLPGLEAMQAGTPVAASKTSSLPEIYKDAAIYFDPSNSRDIADKIKIVLSNEKMRKSLIEKGKKISQQFSWRKTAQQTLEVYKEVMG